MRYLGISILAAVVFCVAGCTTRPSTVVLLVRHAEKVVTKDADPALTAEGEARARALAEALGEVRIDCIITTQCRRTQQTAVPLARERGLEPVVVHASRDIDSHVEDVAAAVRARPAGEAILVVGHSNTIPAIIGSLGGPILPDLSESEYASLFVLVLPAKGEPRLVRSRYGHPDSP